MTFSINEKKITINTANRFKNRHMQVVCENSLDRSVPLIKLLFQFLNGETLVRIKRFPNWRLRRRPIFSSSTLSFFKAFFAISKLLMPFKNWTSIVTGNFRFVSSINLSVCVDVITNFYILHTQKKTIYYSIDRNWSIFLYRCVKIHVK